jgi:thiamine pyrophosphate-dependent acetolactate synthase large subunit-like protein
MNLSEQLVAFLEATPATQVFGVTGDALNAFVAGLSRSETLRWVGMRHEGNAAFAACAQAQLQGLGVCAGTVGPGALHLINGLYNAKRERLPVLAITGQIEQVHRGRDYFQEADLSAAFRDVCAFQAVIRTPDQAHHLFRRALQIAMSQRAVCRIELPRDLTRAEVSGPVEVRLPRVSTDLVPDPEAVAEAAQLIEGAERITLLAGAGGRGARQQVVELSTMLRAPIVHTLRSADTFDHGLDTVVGLTGLIGLPSAYRAVMDCDLLLMLGTDFPYDDYLPRDTKVVQVDLDHGRLGNRVPVDVGIHGDLSRVLAALLPLVRPRTNTAFLAEHRSAFVEFKDDGRARFAAEGDEGPMHPQVLTVQLDEVAARDAVFCLETSTAAIWAARHMTFGGERRLLGSFNHGSMAVALPAAIGAQLACPGREVWALCGDGGFSMSMQDLVTAVNEALPVKIVVFDNASLQLIDLEMERDGEAPNLAASALDNPDFVALARACGADGVRVSAPSEVPAALRRAAESPGPFVVDARVTGAEIPMPPSISLQEAVALITAKAKQSARALAGDADQLAYMKAQLEAMLG